MKIVFIILYLLPICFLSLNPIIEYNWMLDDFSAMFKTAYLYYVVLFIISLFVSTKYFAITLFLVFTFFYDNIVTKNITINSSEHISHLTIYQYNTFQKDLTESIKKDLSKYNPNVLVLQEITTTAGVNAYNAFVESYPFSIGRKPIEGFPSQQLVMSKVPLKNIEIIPYHNGRFKVIKASVEMNNKNVTLYTAHTPSPKTKHNWKNRNDVLFQIRDTMLFSDDPFILVGDLNISIQNNQFERIFLPDFFNYHELPSQYSWSFINIPIISEMFFSNQIDHTISSTEIMLNSKKAIDNKGESDHRPIISSFYIK